MKNAIARIAPAVLAMLWGTAAPVGAQQKDALAAELERWSSFVREQAAEGEMWEQIKQATLPLLTGAQDALANGRRLLAAQRLAAINDSLGAARYLFSRGAGQRKEIAAFEAEWRRVGKQLEADLRPGVPADVASIQPALLRAVAEIARMQVPITYEASLEYGRSTTADSGLYYLGAAQAQREFVAVARSLSEPSAAPGPPLRAIAGELDDLESELLAAYRPPASIEKHREFVVASGALKEARELDAAGMRHGALLRYLQAAHRSAALRSTPRLSADELASRRRILAERLDTGPTDHTLGLTFLEAADADPAVAATVITDVLPRYFAALTAVPPRPAPAQPRLNVTLVRWPYT
jgi:hypothetical protein